MTERGGRRCERARARFVAVDTGVVVCTLTDGWKV